MKTLKIIILLFFLAGVVYSQTPTSTAVNYKIQKQDTCSHRNDTTDVSGFAFFKFAIVADSNIEYSFSGFNNANDSAMVKGGVEGFTSPDWYDATIFKKIITRKQSSATGTTNYRLWIWGLKKQL